MHVKKAKNLLVNFFFTSNVYKKVFYYFNFKLCLNKLKFFEAVLELVIKNFLVFWSDIVKTHNELFRIDQS